MGRLLMALLAPPLALPLAAWGAEPVAQAASQSSLLGGTGGQLLQTVIGLLVVLGVIVGLAWVLKRMQQASPRGGRQVIELVGARALGPRDRLLLVQVGDEQVLLGISPGRITPLHVMAKPVAMPEKAEPVAPEFAQRLMELLGKDQKDKH
ncbi:flagellar biosynthetic protein FliO [Pseudomonas typographi]|uniref:Flagellar protein n=1 Tax=Pseudomonas typographi TaxID=2715964 RepID=A0ABR7Z4S1_9PSED|nr:flagellar biosynthetic protein FliO [Pseudomonas typographi]MBD1553945.1 flagellar biosynthetic protein FliO [Pseudomonas typographi]MBD1588024.1 flagellar biosynthetic protein FliO [Pseudomonas typographi]MBD1600422.1 flagellar biosynthetic protein FliO [Pseudomonas typographi]